jgi:hypothetical protein
VQEDEPLAEDAYGTTPVWTTKREPNGEAHIVEYYLLVVADRNVTKLNPWDNFEGAKPPLGFSPSHVGVNSSTLP